MKKIFCCPALELFCCLPLWKTVLFVSSRAFLLSTPTFLLSTLYKNSEATWKKATKCNKVKFNWVKTDGGAFIVAYFRNESYFSKCLF